MIGNILAWTIWGLLVGFVARAVLPGRQAISVGLTITLGVVGSVLGGFIATFLGFADFYRFDLSSFAGAVIVSVVLLIVFMRVRTRSS